MTNKAYFAKNVKNHGIAYISGVTLLFSRYVANSGSWYLKRRCINDNAAYRE
jgi:hypothetical protein